MQTKSEALKALEEGKTLVGTLRSFYPGKPVEYLPRKDPAGTSNPDFYPWHVVGSPDYDRLPVSEITAASDQEEEAYNLP